MMGKFVAAWILMVLIAIGNGALRETWYGPSLGELQAHQVSTVSGLLLLGVYIWMIVRRWPPESAGQALIVGGIWFALTVAFEFLFGHYVAGHSWSRLLADYNVLAGRVWILVPIWVAVAPYVFYRLRH